MPTSLESARPMMAPSARTSVRYSTYSMAPTVATTDTASNEIRDIQTGLDRMENRALSSQRVALSEEQTNNMNKIALGAKVERALGRRMSSQDAVMKRPVSGGGVPLSEKTKDENENENDEEKKMSEKEDM